MESPYIIHRCASLIALTVLVPACVLDTKITGNPESASTSGATTAPGDPTTTVTSGGDPPTGADNDTGDTSGSTGDTSGSPGDTSGSTSDTNDSPVDTAGDSCEVPGEFWTYPYDGNETWEWTGPIDEACTVVKSAPTLDGFELHLDCPQHAADHGRFRLHFVQEPFPDLPPVGAVLDVYYQPRIIVLGTSHPTMLFLRSEGALLYSFVHGSFVDPNDVAIAAARYAPLTVEVEPGPCPLSDNLDVEEPGEGFTCARHALAMVRVALAESSIVLGTGFSGDLAAGPDGYSASVLWTVRGEDCVGLDPERSAVVIARTSLP